jgi:TctA family transporter
MAHAFLTALKATWLSHQMVTQPWLWAICETLHFIGLALLIGAAGFFDLRLMGFMRRIPLSAAMPLRRWAALGVGINLVTGVMFFVGAPDQYVDNPAWWGKVAFLAIAMINIAFFETRLGHALLMLPDGEDTPRGVKIVGAVSIASWFMVLYLGRMLPFIGNAF